MSTAKSTSPDAAGDPVDKAIATASDGMPADDRRQFKRLVRLGFKRMASSAPPAILAEEIEPALELDESDRLAWARAFAVVPLVRDLNRRALAMTKELASSGTANAAARREAKAISTGLDGIDLDGLNPGDRRRIQRQIGEARIEVRHLLSGGTGPRSLRAGRIRRGGERSSGSQSETTES